MPTQRSLHRAAILEPLESRRLLSGEIILGTSGNDHIVISFDPDTHDVILNGASNFADGTIFPNTKQSPYCAYIDAGDGDDTIEILAEPFVDQKTPAWFNMYGGAGDDTIIAGRGHDSLDGGAGDDTLIGSDDLMQFAHTAHGVA